MAAEEHVLDYIILTAEPGVIGGMPTGGKDFGSAINGDAILEQPAQFDFYDGGGLDAAFLGMAQADAQGNVNVSRFGPRLAGSGGFINISQNAKKVAFLGTFLAPCRTQVVDGRIAASDDGVAAPKFLASVEQRTFSGQYAAAAGQPVLYVTERCVFRLTPDGLELIEIAPGIDLEKDVLAHVGFTPIINGEPKLMDERLFRDEPMGLKDDLLTVPLDARFPYDADRNIFFINMEGLSVYTAAEAAAIVAEIEKRLAAVGKKVLGRGQLRQLLPGARPHRHVYVGSPQPCGALLRERHPLHHQLVHASQTQSAISPRADWPHTSTKAARKHSTGCRAPETDPIQRDEDAREVLPYCAVFVETPTRFAAQAPRGDHALHQRRRDTRRA